MTSVPTSLSNSLLWIPHKDLTDKIPCSYFQNKDSNLLMIYSHDATSKNDSFENQTKLFFSKNLTKWNVNVLFWEINTLTQKIIDQHLQIIYHFATETLKYSPYNIILYGYAIGTGPTCQLANKVSDKIAGLILHCPFTTFDETKIGGEPTESHARSLSQDSQAFPPLFLKRGVWDNTDLIKKIKTPLLIIQGGLDSLIPCDHGKQIYHCSSASDKTLYRSDKFDHFKSINFDSVSEYIAIFLKNSANSFLFDKNQPIAPNQSYFEQPQQI